MADNTTTSNNVTNLYKIEDIYHTIKVKKSFIDDYQHAKELFICCNYKQIDNIYFSNFPNLLISASYSIVLYNPCDFEHNCIYNTTFIEDTIFSFDYHSIICTIPYHNSYTDASLIKNSLRLLIDLDYTLLHEDSCSDYYIWTIKGSIKLDTAVDVVDENLKNRILKTLEINDHSEIFMADIFNLTSLDASNCNISDLKGLEYASNLTYLNLSNNRIKEIPCNLFDNLILLEELNLQDNKIKSIASGSFDNLINLKILNIKNNNLGFGLGTLPDCIFDKLDNLVILNLEGNCISSLFNLNNFAINLKEKCEINISNQNIFIDNFSFLYKNVIEVDNNIGLSLYFINDIEGNSLYNYNYKPNYPISSTCVLYYFNISSSSFGIHWVNGYTIFWPKDCSNTIQFEYHDEYDNGVFDIILKFSGTVVINCNS